MKGLPAALALLALLWLALALATSLALGLAWRAIERRLARSGPERRAASAFRIALAPLALPSAAALLCVLPGLVGALLGVGDHCSAHADHPHLCLVHAGRLPIWLVVVAGMATGALAIRAGAATGPGLLAQLRERAWLARRRLEGESPTGVRRIAGRDALALTHGLVRPRIWISQHLLDALTPAEQEVVIAHERAHVERRDPARLLAARIAGVLHLPGVRLRLDPLLRLATEQVCDRRAARAVGDPLLVASTLLRVERLIPPRPVGVGTAALVDDQLPARIAALLAPDAGAAPPPSPRPLLPSVVLACTVLLLARPLHHLAEHGLERVLRSLVGVLPLS